MVTVEEALKSIEENAVLGPIVALPLIDAMEHTLAVSVSSPIDMPPFQQSAMDGYAISSNGSDQFTLIDEVKAGDTHEPLLNEGEAIRIFTGAPVPRSADTVIRQEDVQVNGTTLIAQPLPRRGANIRPQAEQIAKGAIALEKGAFLNEAAIGYLATLGITEVQVFKQPKVSILVTGNELIEPGRVLEYGQIYESNAIMLQTALKRIGISHVHVHRVPDNYESTKAQLAEMLDRSDMIICSGGISVGDYDFVGKALRELGVNEVFYKVKQKPGKPLFYGKRDNKQVFALPGNPAAALTCFYVYVSKAIALFMNHKKDFAERVTKKLSAEYIRKGDRAQFLKANVQGDDVSILGSQSSAMLNTFALANALVYIPLTEEIHHEGTEVECILIP